MDILNDLFVNIYLNLDAWIRGLLHGAGLRPDAENVLTAFIMGLIVVVVLVGLAVGAVGVFAPRTHGTRRDLTEIRGELTPAHAGRP